MVSFSNVVHYKCNIVLWNWPRKTNILPALKIPKAEYATIPDSKIYWANMGPIWGRQDPGGPHVGSMNFAIWDAFPVYHAIFFSVLKHRDIEKGLVPNGKSAPKDGVMVRIIDYRYSTTRYNACAISKTIRKTEH